MQAMDNNAKIEEVLKEAKAILAEIMDQVSDPKEELIDIWEAWFDRMTNGSHPVYLTPWQVMGLKDCFDKAYVELTGNDVPRSPT
jgi:hypothetical protein